MDKIFPQSLIRNNGVQTVAHNGEAVGYGDAWLDAVRI